mgnify:CR=1 FL=1
MQFVRLLVFRSNMPVILTALEQSNYGTTSSPGGRHACLPHGDPGAGADSPCGGPDHHAFGTDGDDRDDARRRDGQPVCVRGATGCHCQRQRLCQPEQGEATKQMLPCVGHN